MISNNKALESAKIIVEYFKNKIKAAKNRIKHCENVLNALIGE